MPTIRPQKGPQSRFLESSADIAIFGGSAGSGKSYALLLEAARHTPHKEYRGVIFRRTNPQITAGGGLWDASSNLYASVGANPNISTKEWRFPSGGKIAFKHLQHESNIYDWQGSEIPLVGWDELTHFCYHPDTEVLTGEGWKKVGELQVGDQAMALTPEWEARLEPIVRTWEFDFDGELHETANRSIRYSVTPNHKMVIRRSGSKGSLQKHWDFCEAKDLPEYPNYPFQSDWNGKEIGWVSMDSISGQGVGRNQNSAAGITADDYLSLLGWYLSEGSSYLATKSRGGTSPCVSIRQTKPCQQLADLMARLPYRVKSDGEGGYRIYSRQLYNHFKPMGETLYTKRLPRWVLDLSRRQLQIVFDSFAMGDGSLAKTGAMAFGLANDGLIDDLQEISVRIGRRATKGKAVTKDGFTVHRLYVHARHGGNVQDKPWHKKTRKYKGKVYCPTVEPSHTLLCRYEGRVFWSGNTERQFFYLLSRNRTTIGVRPYVRATCNPDAGSWVAVLLSWWIDQETGYPIPERSGVLRYFYRKGDDMLWYSSAREAMEANPDLAEQAPPKSLTFIPAKLSDNAILCQRDPGYKANLMALSWVERSRLLDGNWKVTAADGMFRSDWFGHGEPPTAWKSKVRAWDFAATEANDQNDPDYTVGVLMGLDINDKVWVLDVQRVRYSPGRMKSLVKATAEADGANVRIVIEQEPGSSGKYMAHEFRDMLSGYSVTIDRPDKRTGDKVARASGYSAAVEKGTVLLGSGAWAKPFVGEHIQFPFGSHDDQVDAAASCWRYLVGRKVTFLV